MIKLIKITLPIVAIGVACKVVCDINNKISYLEKRINLDVNSLHHLIVNKKEKN